MFLLETTYNHVPRMFLTSPFDVCAFCTKTCTLQIQLLEIRGANPSSRSNFTLARSPSPRNSRNAVVPYGQEFHFTT